MELTDYEEYLLDPTKNGKLSAHDAKLFQTAYKATKIEELDFVVENANSIMVQDYALKKKIQWFNKLNPSIN